jgi:hypothetical protein
MGNLPAWTLTAITLDTLGRQPPPPPPSHRRPLDSIRSFVTSKRLSTEARACAWIHIYFISALLKANRPAAAAAAYRRALAASPLAPTVPLAHATRTCVFALEAPPEPLNGVLWDLATGSYHVVTEMRGTRVQTVADARRVVEAFVAPRGEAWRRDAEEFAVWRRGEVLTREKELEARQFTRDCAKGRFLVVELGRQDGRVGRVDGELAGFGFGAQMHVITVAMTYAIRTNRTLVM